MKVRSVKRAVFSEFSHRLLAPRGRVILWPDASFAESVLIEAAGKRARPSRKVIYFPMRRGKSNIKVSPTLLSSWYII